MEHVTTNNEMNVEFYRARVKLNFNHDYLYII